MDIFTKMNFFKEITIKRFKMNIHLYAFIQNDKLDYNTALNKTVHCLFLRLSKTKPSTGKGPSWLY